MLTILIVSFVSLVSLVNAAGPYTFIYTNESKDKLVYVTIADSSKSLENSALNCLVMEGADAYNNALSSTSDPIKQLNDETFNSLLSSCNAIQLKSKVFGINKSTIKNAWNSMINVLDDLLIAPGTKWCGKGNRAANYDDLGSSAEADACCRAHDHCPKVLLAGQSLYGLVNDQGFTSCHCECDHQLKACLKEAAQKDKAADLIGALFFNVLKSKCFQEIELESEVVAKERCSEEPGSINKRCISAADAEANAIEPVYQFTTAGSY